MKDRYVSSTPQNYTRWLRVAVIGLLPGLASYSAWQRDRGVEPSDRPAASPPGEHLPTDPPARNDSHAPKVISSQTIRDQDGKILFRGDIDLDPTLQRIQRQEKLRFANDGTIFQNRERRLPRQPTGYYREFVHPTPGISGPGPQRIVVGREGETYYTPDHYRSFRRIDE